MANIILPNTNTLNTEAVNGVEKDVIKDKPSLFDSLLKESISQKEEIPTQNKIDKNVVNEKSIDTVAVVKKDENQSVLENTKSQSSLLDRLVVEVKQEIKDNQEILKIPNEEIKKEDTVTQNKIDNNLLDKKSVETVETVNQDENSSLENTKTLNTQAVNSVEKDVIKDKPSLFDSLLKESISQKEEIPTQNKIDKNVVNEKSIDIVIDKNVVNEKSIDIVIDKNVVNEKSIDIVIDKNVVNEKSVDTVAVVKKDENQSVLENTKSQSSLLDRLVVEVKQEIKDNQEILKIPNEEIKKEDTVTQNKIDTNLIDGESVDKVVVKQDENKNVLEKTKSQSSLLDRLVVEVKEEIKDNQEVLKIPNEEVIKNEIIVENKTDKNLVDKKIVETTETVKKDLPISEEVVQLTNKTVLSDNNIEEEIIVKKEILPSEDVIKNSSSDSLIFENKTKSEKNKSLMDLLIQKNIEKSGIIVVDESIETVDSSTSNKDLLSSMYLGNQKNIVNNQLLFNKNEAMQLLKEGSSLKDIEKSANLLELGLDNVDVEQNIGIDTLEVVKKQEIEMLGRKNSLDKLMFDKNIKSDEIKNIITQSVEASKALIENTLNINENVVVNVNSPLSYNIQSRIIGAKQQMSTMMSDIARQMYENYKPPVTVFKLNLNPLELGSISILMKNDKNNALTISMNVSNMTTLDALIDNQNILKNALNKTFDENTKFNLDFSSSNQNNNQSSNSGQNNQNGRFEQQMDTQSVLQLKEENKEVEEKILDYM